MLMVTMMVIAAFAVMPTIAFEIRRDREQEMIHRGVQYSRAIRNLLQEIWTLPNATRRSRQHQQSSLPAQTLQGPSHREQDFKLLHYGDPGCR
jgi:hypothetical protein